MYYTLTAEDHRTGKVNKTSTDDYESALRIFDGAVALAEKRELHCTISMYLANGTLHQTKTIGGEVVRG